MTVAKTERPVEATMSAVRSTTFMGCRRAPDLERLDIACVGVGWDGGTRRRAGSRHAPTEVRVMSERIHALHPDLAASPFDHCAVGDVGDVEVALFDQAQGMASIEAFYERVSAAGVSPVTIGGDHLVTLPILRAIRRDEPLAMVQFDAHADTSDASVEGHRYTSSTPIRRAVEEGLLDPTRIVQIGLRGTVRNREGQEWGRQQGIRQVTMDELYDNGIAQVAAEVRRVIGDHPTYVSFDIDGLDPAFAPGTGAPVAGGLTSYEALRLLRGLFGATVVGGDVVEISPPYDVQRQTALVGATIVFEIICLVARTCAPTRFRRRQRHDGGGT